LWGDRRELVDGVRDEALVVVEGGGN
jgi:hypothetical protein